MSCGRVSNDQTSQATDFCILTSERPYVFFCISLPAPVQFSDCFSTVYINFSLKSLVRNRWASLAYESAYKHEIKIVKIKIIWAAGGIKTSRLTTNRYGTNIRVQCTKLLSQNKHKKKQCHIYKVYESITSELEHKLKQSYLQSFNKKKHRLADRV